jgi:hypothetical protein
MKAFALKDPSQAALLFKVPVPNPPTSLPRFLPFLSFCSLHYCMACHVAPHALLAQESMSLFQKALALDPTNQKCILPLRTRYSPAITATPLTILPIDMQNWWRL